MIDSPLVSIICTAYNHEAFIKDALEGFVIQKTNFPFEIIVHDDASTDNTANIIRVYEAKYPELFINIYQTENQYSKGNGDVAKIVFSAARGKYIALCEGDDYWTDPYKLQKQVDFLEANKDFIMCFHPVNVVYEGNVSRSYPYAPANEISVTEDIINNHFIPTLSLVFRNILPKKFPKWFHKIKSGDVALELILSLNGKVYKFDQEMGVCRRHIKGISNNAEQQKYWQFPRIELLVYFNRYSKYVYNVTIKNYFIRNIRSLVEVIKNDEKGVFNRTTKLTCYFFKTAYLILPSNLIEVHFFIEFLKHYIYVTFNKT